jgi:hypothetical protein
VRFRAAVQDMVFGLDSTSVKPHWFSALILMYQRSEESVQQNHSHGHKYFSGVVPGIDAKIGRVGLSLGRCTESHHRNSKIIWKHLPFARAFINTSEIINIEEQIYRSNLTPWVLAKKKIRRLA